MPATPPAKRRVKAFSGAPAAAKKKVPATILLFMYSKTRNCVPRLGATLRQLAPLPLKRPVMPPSSHARRSSARMPPTSLPRHIITVETISSGAHAVREMMPAIAPA